MSRNTALLKQKQEDEKSRQEAFEALRKEKSDELSNALNAAAEELREAVAREQADGAEKLNQSRAEMNALLDKMKSEVESARQELNAMQKEYNKMIAVETILW